MKLGNLKRLTLAFGHVNLNESTYIDLSVKKAPNTMLARESLSNHTGWLGFVAQSVLDSTVNVLIQLECLT